MAELLLLAQASDAAPVAAASGTVAPAREAKEAFPPFDTATFASQLFWLAITFVTLYLLLRRVAIPRIGGILRGRAERIAGDLSEAQRAKEESEAAIAAYEKALASARANASAIAEGARNDAKAIAVAERKTTEAELAGKLAAAEARISDIKTRALADVGSIASEATTAIVKALIGSDVGKGDADAAVADALKAGR
jgi:F-type H+-transporting ATPase subunit b